MVAPRQFEMSDWIKESDSRTGRDSATGRQTRGDNELIKSRGGPDGSGSAVSLQQVVCTNAFIRPY